MSSANVNVENVLRERSQNFLNVQVSDFLNHQMSNKQSIIMKTSKSNLSPEQNYRIFQRNLQLQKQILSDQDVLHTYQTQLFAKQIIKPETCHYVSKRPSTQHFKPTLANEFAIPQRNKKPEMMKNIDKIDEDLEILAQLFYARKLYQKFMKQLELNMVKQFQLQKRAMRHMKRTLYRAFIGELKRKSKVTKFKKSLKM